VTDGWYYPLTSRRMAHWFHRGRSLCRTMHRGGFVSVAPPRDACPVCTDLLVPGWKAGKSRNHYTEGGVPLCTMNQVRLTISPSPVKSECDRCARIMELRRLRAVEVAV